MQVASIISRICSIGSFRWPRLVLIADDPGIEQDWLLCRATPADSGVPIGPGAAAALDPLADEEWPAAMARKCGSDASQTCTDVGE